MDIHSLEYQRAETLDQILKLVGRQSSGQQFLFAKLAVQSRMDDESLGKLLNEERKIFKVITTGMNMANGKQASFVSLTQFGKEQLEKGWTFIKQLEQDENGELERRKREAAKQRWAWLPKAGSVFFGICTLVLAYFTLEATRENKLHNEKEERWEVEKRELLSQIKVINDKYYTIPDSIRGYYEKTLSSKEKLND